MDVAERQRAPDTLPAFQRLQHALQNEPRFAEEVALGRRVGAYKFIKDIGRGNFSKVKLAAHQLTRDNVAVKIVDRSRLDTRAQRMLEVEVLALDSLRHSNILRLFEVIEMWNRVYLITEFIAGGELYNKISLDGPIGESQALVLFRQLIAAVKYMHSNFFVHRDIKAENVLLVSETKVKLADFGFSTKLKEPLEKLDTFCGSPPYAAPELFTEDHYIGQLVDVWALGVLLYFMVVGNMPFRAPTVPALRAAVLRGHYLLPSTLSLPCGRVIQRILVQSPLHRPSLDDLTNSQWMRLGAIEEPHRVATGQPKKAASRFGVFWRRNSTRRNSGRKMRKVDEVLPIACSTKRTESVLAADYLFPLGEEEVGGGNSEPVGAPSKDKEKEREKRPSRRSMFSSLGLGLKTRIGPMDSTTAVVMVKGGGGGGGDDTVNANDVLEEEKKPKHSSDDNNIEVCGENSKDFETAPTFKGESPEEVEALRILNNWGISNAMLEEALPSGARNELMGIYRIVVHRLQMQRERQAAATVAAGQIKTKESGGVSARKGGRSKDKGGGCAGKCSGNNSNCVIL